MVGGRCPPSGGTARLRDLTHHGVADLRLRPAGDARSAPQVGRFPRGVDRHVARPQPSGMVVDERGSCFDSRGGQETNDTPRSASGPTRRRGWRMRQARAVTRGRQVAGSVAALKRGPRRTGDHSARHAAGLLYTPRGPLIAVVMSYDARGVTLSHGRALGNRVAALAAGEACCPVGERCCRRLELLIRDEVRADPRGVRP
jgi:hypothetical protein